MRSTPHIVVAGAGAMGSLFGGLLAERGARVTLLGRGEEHIEAIRRRGLSILGHGGDRTVRIEASTKAGEISPADIVFVQCKATATEAVAASILAFARPDSVIVSFQNGIGNDGILASALGPGRVIGGLTSLGATLEGPGIVRSYATLPTSIGELRGGLSGRVEALAALMTGHGIPTAASGEILVEKWRKLLLNVALSATSGLTGLTIGAIAAFPPLAAVARRAMDEAASVAVASGVPLPEERRDRIFAEVVGSGAARNKTSMRRDIEAGRPTEVGAIYDSVIALGRDHGVPTPTLEALSALVSALELRSPAP